RPRPPDPDGRIAVDRLEEPIGAGPFRVERLPAHVVVDCLIDHALVVRSVGADGLPLPGGARIQHNGPIWGFASVEEPGGSVLLAAGGVEDHPLDRTGGSFGYIDSFVFLYRVVTSAPNPPSVTRLAAVNVSELGVITPKALALWQDTDGVRVVVTG